jgi:hypothetical protein
MLSFCHPYISDSGVLRGIFVLSSGDDFDGFRVEMMFKIFRQINSIAGKSPKPNWAHGLGYRPK